ncbi:MAG TPA: hypothetical protein DCW29_19150 [Janthinobacterium sp.]|nr:hypothetical protein [Janthinobacterium sp.]
MPLVTDAGISSLPDPAAVAAGLARTYPYAAGNITVTRRAPLLMPGSSTNYSWWSSALSQLEATRVQEDATAFYFGFTSGPSSDNVVGLGYVPDHASGRGPTSALGLDAGATGIGSADPFGNVWPEWLTVLLHEVGHNHSLKHIACGPVANADPSYPYPNGDLGPQSIYSSVYGDTQLGRLSQPMATNTSGKYERMKDVMSYCDGVWFSDFSYVRAQQFAEAHSALNAQAGALVAKATKAAPGNGYLSISGSIDANGVQLRAPVASSARPAMAAGRAPYILRVLTVAGQTLDLPFDVTEVGDGKGNASHFWISLDNPGDIASIDVLLNGKVLPQAAARVVAAKLVAGAQAPASLDWTLLNGRLELRWNAVAEPFVSVLHIAANGVKTVLATNLGGGAAALDVRALPAGGQFEVSLATTLKARLVSIPQP